MNLIVSLILFSNQLITTIFAMDLMDEQIELQQFKGYSMEWPPIGGIKNVENVKMKNKEITMPDIFSEPSMAIEKTIKTLMDEFEYFGKEWQKESGHWKELEDFLPSDIFERHNFDVIVVKIKNNMKNIVNLYKNKQWNDLLENKSFTGLIDQIKKLPKLGEEKWKKLNKLDIDSSAVNAVKNIWKSMDEFIENIQIDLDKFIDCPMRESLMYIMASLEKEFWKKKEHLKKLGANIIEGFKLFTMEPIEEHIIKEKNILMDKMQTILQQNKNERNFLGNVPKEFKIYTEGIIDYEKIFEEIFSQELDKHDLKQMKEKLKFLEEGIELLKEAKVKKEIKKELKEKEKMKKDLDDLIKIRIGINECVQNIRNGIENDLRILPIIYKSKAKYYASIQLEYYLIWYAEILSNSLLKLAENNGFKVAEDKNTEAYKQLMYINILTMEMEGNDYEKFGQFSVYRLFGKWKNKYKIWPKSNRTEEEIAKLISQLLGAFNSANEHWKIRKFWENLDQKSREEGGEMFSRFIPKEGRRIGKLELGSGRDLAEILYEIYKKVNKRVPVPEEKKRFVATAAAAESSSGSKGRKQKNIII